MFRATGSRALRYKGITPEQLARAGPGGEFAAAIVSAGESIVNKVPNVKEAEIQGSTPHKSSRDLTDPAPVITVGYNSENGTRLLSAHVHQDGSWKAWPSRAGRRVTSVVQLSGLTLNSTQEAASSSAQNVATSWTQEAQTSASQSAASSGMWCRFEGREEYYLIISSAVHESTTQPPSGVWISDRNAQNQHLKWMRWNGAAWEFS